MALKPSIRNFIQAAHLPAIWVTLVHNRTVLEESVGPVAFFVRVAVVFTITWYIKSPFTRLFILWQGKFATDDCQNELKKSQKIYLKLRFKFP